MADKDPVERPSFLSYLKRDKEKGKDKKSSGSKSTTATSTSGATDSSPGNQDGLSKNQVRRAQVRRAQIQHRQRKANYVKQLEMDISQLRELITQAQHDTSALRRENDDMMAFLDQNGIPSPPGLTHSTGSPSAATVLSDAQNTDNSQQPTPAYPIMDNTDLLLSGNYGLDEELIVTLSSNKLMGTPAFSVNPSSTNSSYYTGQVSAAWSQGQVQLTPAQELSVINFILALEHVCWDHFWVGDCHNHSAQTEEEKGHTLMASSYLMANAPESIYTEREAFRSRFRSAPTLRWPASTVTLDSLYGLAQSLNPGGDEVAPVQAWFELASRYPVDDLLRPDTLEALKREFKGVVRCVAFGAAMERGAFESIVLRVLGPDADALALL
ncbi:hypothetical protein ISF_00900 [Cordyceps fumosorosea ARSEF 2679]|uniref:BZIP-type transcription factor n=1 Tax=Cordyceps fumosorosea (strain ARSEF 2679) TaxID=1081104 RepID=A0A162N1I5_CORFA|nr:hypothetical protein ISF_00900 [Cordyceps fumosorosea ARSEF 2679]OAA73999.1 hypothetical protein ISF_00900 [Cordyceps fumosorosea ARSEF 2679]